MNFIEIFNRDYYDKLNNAPFLRGSGFRFVFSHIEPLAKTRPVVIVETGTLRQWDGWSDGQSTLLWDLFLTMYQGTCYSLDIDPAAQTLAASHTQHVQYVLGDSIVSLHQLKDVENADVLYLDSYDLDQQNPSESALHHLMELTCVFPKLKSGCLVIVDDCLSDVCGKHMYVKKFMTALGIEPEFVGYQHIWRIP